MYEQGARPVDLIKMFNVSDQTFYRHRKQESWVKPSAAQALAKRPTREQEVQTGLERGESGECVSAAKHADPAQDETNRAHLAASLALRSQLHRIMALEDLGAEGPRERPSRALAELVQSLERIQKIERLALRMDTGSGAMQAVVIIVPGKATEEEWVAQAVELREGRDFEVTPAATAGEVEP